jgi:hypothetical protein
MATTVYGSPDIETVDSIVTLVPTVLPSALETYAVNEGPSKIEYVIPFIVDIFYKLYKYFF